MDLSQIQGSQPAWPVAIRALRFAGARALATRRTAVLGYAGLLAAFAGSRLATLPIGPGDTDVWYHLNGGRYIAANGWLPSESFFSFIDPPRVWTNYYWLFQVLAYAVYSVASFPGLVLVPALAYVLTLYLIYRVVGVREALSLYAVGVFALYALFLLPRFQLVRPHLVTYVCIVAMILILERAHPRARLALPFIAVLWANFHGVAYPVLLLIGFAYSAELVVQRLRGRAKFTASDVRTLGVIAVTMYAVLLTPHGIRLLEIPFAPVGPAAYYIHELRPARLEEFLSFGFSTSSWSLTYETFRNVLVAALVLALVSSALNRSIRVSHVVLTLGGIALLFRSARFTYEFLLLSVPLLAANPLRLPSVRPAATRLVVGGVALSAAFMPFLFISAYFSNAAAFPVSQTHLPHGVVKFLRHVDVGGRLLNHPNNGGFYQWALGDRYKIYMDMEVPFLFTNEDFFLITQALEDPEVLKRLIGKYEPDFVAVPLWHRQGGASLKAAAPEYTLVFADDMEALYVNRARHPEIADRYEMKAIDPFSLPGVVPGSAGMLAPMLPEADRLLEIHPESGFANHIAGLVRNDRGEHAAALGHADRIVLHHPQSVPGYLLRAEVLRAQGRVPEAVAAYEAAVDRANEGARMAISKRLGVLLFEAGQHERAYRMLRLATNVFSASTTHQDLYYLGAATFETGRIDQAAVILRLGLHKLPAGDELWHSKYSQYLTRLR